ncbi:MAG: hypothetical protein A3J79_13025 [Elusimicrobia bacterium RIFOXYB2_FULL_62_6]|nr:MAG: hypothetical protein A3J79_13025 [Elusimicrobia bacterium RIFOXYB2_FULL_62_6]
MKILLISSSPKGEKSLTFALAAEALKGAAAAGADTETVHLSGRRIEFCRSCEACHRNDMRCVMIDDAGPVLEKMLEADGLVLASPNYINQVTASMKALFDRTSNFIHCKRLLGKYAAGAVSSGSGRAAETLDYIAYYSSAAGAQYSGGVSCDGRGPDAAKKAEAFKLGEKLVSDIKNKTVFAGQAEAIEKGRKFFSAVIKMRKNDWDAEYKYYAEKGWL